MLSNESSRDLYFIWPIVRCARRITPSRCCACNTRRNWKAQNACVVRS